MTTTALSKVAQPNTNLIERAISSALTGLAESSRRVYQARIRAWLTWQIGQPAPPAPVLDRENVKAHIRALELGGASAVVMNQTLAALKRLSTEAAELGWIEPSAAAQIERIKSKRVLGGQTGTWLTTAQVEAILAAPDLVTVQGRRDQVVLALLIGCGLRRAEACKVEVAQLRTMGNDARMVITNLIGKGGRTRSVAVPDWCAQIIQQWLTEISK